LNTTKPVRVFVGLPVPADVRDHLEKLRLTAREATKTIPGKWVPPENWHITLTFIGSLDPAQIDRLIELLEEKYSGYQPFDALLSGVRWFPGEFKPRMIVAEVQLNAQLLAIKLRSDQAVKAMDIPPDKRSYRPHITLARFNQRLTATHLPEPASQLAGIRVDQITLYQSVPIDSGVKYVDLHNITLG
jgi:2'-5' RNA ligase